MTTTNHYRESEDILKRTDRRSGTSQHDLAAAQVHALLAIADELRNFRDGLVEIRGRSVTGPGGDP
jgi:hypothetical protein